MHRVGGIEKHDGSGNINYGPENHQAMTLLRQAKVDKVADDYDELVVRGDGDADICILGWGSTWAAIDSAVQRQRRAGHKVAWIHLTNINPLPNDLGEKLARFDHVLVPELNSGQLCRVVRAKYLIDAKSLGKIAGLPFIARDIEDRIEQMRAEGAGS
jgi:2-oxoglutarate ferredoxin oxidoreductase subunit alpha